MAHPFSEPVHLDFYYFLTLSRSKLWYCNEGYGLADPMTDAKAIVSHDFLKCFGPAGSEASGRHLLERLFGIYNKWTDLGCPHISDYSLKFIPRNLFHGPLPMPADPRWVIERVHHLEEASLGASSTN